MKPVDIVAQIKKTRPELFGVMPEKRAAALVREVLQIVGQTVLSQEEGKVVVAGLGSFVVKSVEAGGTENTTKKRRIIFRPPVARKV